MTLPGKLCVGILEEDNPLKSYFRFKPLLVAQEDGYVPFSTARRRFPRTAACASCRTKTNPATSRRACGASAATRCSTCARTRAKTTRIRPNKNYHVDPGETNAYIVYSDVVVEPPAGHAL